MPRNAEVIRQWNLLRTLDARRHGATVKELARELGVTTRTIWRDVAALQEVGFPLIDERDGRETRWKLSATPFRGLADLGVSTMELCSLYVSRAMVEGMAGTPFGPALKSICEKLERLLPARLREFLDRLPTLLEAKTPAPKLAAGRKQEQHLERLIEATIEQRVCDMRYFSASNQRMKNYRVHPYRLVHADGGMYLVAWVPEYSQIRTFAVERIQKLSVAGERFTEAAALTGSAFAHSLGVNRGKPERVLIAFSPRVAPYVRERKWHKSQRIEELPDKGIRLTLNVSVDYALRAWILSFGPFAKVEAPARLAEEILEQLEEAREAYAPRLDLTLPQRVFSRAQLSLPGIKIFRTA
jgi:predicted DNA-binding transcriptional regulator YafY